MAAEAPSSDDVGDNQGVLSIPEDELCSEARVKFELENPFAFATKIQLYVTEVALCDTMVKKKIYIYIML
jgi:hypothetical protein